MSATQVSPDQIIKSIPLEKDRCPLCRTILSSIALIFATTIFCVFTGVSLALAEIGFSVATGGLVAGVIGLIMGVAASVLLKVEASDKHMKYRIATLEQIENRHVNSKVLMCIRLLKGLLGKTYIEFKQVSDNHKLHTWTTHVTEKLDKSITGIKKVWENFLKNMHKYPVYNPDGRKIELDFTYELDRLDGKTFKVTQGFLDKNSHTFEKDLQKVEELQRESFGIESFVFSASSLMEKLKEDFRNQCAVVRREDTGEILGFAWYYYSKKRKGTCIAGLGRIPGAVHYSIGSRLMEIVVKNLLENSNVYLQVRESNIVAQSLYSNFGFEKTKVLNGYYSYPTEDAHFMGLNWDKYREIINKRESTSGHR